ncbi:hypothetical protein SRHO_G00314760 [Serrasalmus rhombeus]
MVSFRRDLRDLSADQCSSLVTDNMPPPGSFSSLNVNDATDTLRSTLSSCLDDLCPLTTRVIRSNKPQPWLKNDTVRELRSRLRAAERKWREKCIHADLKNYQLLLASFSTCLTTPKAEFYHSKINSLTDSRKLFATFNTLLNPPPPATCLTADALTSFFTGKVAAISSQFTDAMCSGPTTCSAPLYPSTKESAEALRKAGEGVEDQRKETRSGRVETGISGTHPVLLSCCFVFDSLELVPEGCQGMGLVMGPRPLGSCSKTHLGREQDHIQHCCSAILEMISILRRA